MDHLQRYAIPDLGEIRDRFLNGSRCPNHLATLRLGICPRSQMQDRGDARQFIRQGQSQSRPGSPQTTQRRDRPPTANAIPYIGRAPSQPRRATRQQLHWMCAGPWRHCRSGGRAARREQWTRTRARKCPTHSEGRHDVEAGRAFSSSYH
jgi:hypothetical protein